jgi:hypothetical protein
MAATDDSRLTTDESRRTMDDNRLTTDDNRRTTDDNRRTMDDHVHMGMRADSGRVPADIRQMIEYRLDNIHRGEVAMVVAQIKYPML